MDIKWQLGLGDKTKFWRDCWIEGKALKENRACQSLIIHFENVVGDMVKDYIEGSSRQRQWKKLIALVEELMEVCADGQAKLDKWPIVGPINEDKMAWGG